MPVSSRKSSKASRFEARISPEKKVLWQRAAELRGNTLTEFVIDSADDAAERTIREAEFMELTRRDRIAFIETLLTAPAPPNAKLRKAAERHGQVQVS